MPDASSVYISAMLFLAILHVGQNHSDNSFLPHNKQCLLFNRIGFSSFSTITFGLFLLSCFLPNRACILQHQLVHSSPGSLSTPHHLQYTCFCVLTLDVDKEDKPLEILLLIGSPISLSLHIIFLC